MSSQILYLDETSFKDTIDGAQGPVLVDFWASWCGPCMAMNPIIEEIATEYAGKLTVAKVNVDTSPELAAEYRITSIPAMKIFKGGEIVEELIGSRPKPVLEKELSAHI